MSRAHAAAAALGLDGLSRQAGGLHATPDWAATRDRAILRSEGDVWLVVFGADEFRVRGSRGLAHLAQLVSRPGQELHALDLVGHGVVGERSIDDGLAVADERGLPMIDATARAAYRARASALAEEIADARTSRHRPSRTAARRIGVHQRRVVAATGLGGRERRTGSSAERAALSVTRAISAMDRLAERSPALGAHLRATVRTGAYCSYRPDPRAPIHWEV